MKDAAATASSRSVTRAPVASNPAWSAARATPTSMAHQMPSSAPDRREASSVTAAISTNTIATSGLREPPVMPTANARYAPSTSTIADTARDDPGPTRRRATSPATTTTRYATVNGTRSARGRAELGEREDGAGGDHPQGEEYGEPVGEGDELLGGGLAVGHAKPTKSPPSPNGGALGTDTRRIRARIVRKPSTKAARANNNTKERADRSPAGPMGSSDTGESSNSGPSGDTTGGVWTTTSGSASGAPAPVDCGIDGRAASRPAMFVEPERAGGVASANPTAPSGGVVWSRPPTVPPSDGAGTGSGFVVVVVVVAAGFVVVVVWGFVVVVVRGFVVVVAGFAVVGGGVAGGRATGGFVTGGLVTGGLEDPCSEPEWSHPRPAPAGAFGTATVVVAPGRVSWRPPGWDQPEDDPVPWRAVPAVAEAAKAVRAKVQHDAPSSSAVSVLVCLRTTRRTVPPERPPGDALARST